MFGINIPEMLVRFRPKSHLNFRWLFCSVILVSFNQLLMKDKFYLRMCE